MEFVVKGGDAPTPVVFGDYEIGAASIGPKPFI